MSGKRAPSFELLLVIQRRCGSFGVRMAAIRPFYTMILTRDFESSRCFPYPKNRTWFSSRCQQEHRCILCVLICVSSKRIHLKSSKSKKINHQYKYYYERDWRLVEIASSFCFLYQVLLRSCQIAFYYGDNGSGRSAEIGSLSGCERVSVDMHTS